MTDSNFKIDEKKARLGEEKVAELFEKNYNCKIMSFNRDKRYDFKYILNNKEKTVEVKSDWYCFPPQEKTYPFGKKIEEGRDTGNLFIEFECRGNSSGIDVTESNYYAYYYTYFKKVWIIETNKLKKLIQDNKFKVKDKEVGDKDSNTKGYVIPRDKFVNHFRVVDIDFEWPY